jgi:hypothetical protein
MKPTADHLAALAITITPNRRPFDYYPGCTVIETPKLGVSRFTLNTL